MFPSVSSLSFKVSCLTLLQTLRKNVSVLEGESVSISLSLRLFAFMRSERLG